MADASFSGRSPRADRARLALLAGSLLALVAALLIAATGGWAVAVAQVRLSMRSPRGAVLTGGVLMLAWVVAVLRAGALRRDLGALGHHAERLLPRVPALLAAGTFVTTWWLGTPSPAGADASGYLSQAALWAHAHASFPDVLATLPGWPDAPMASVPLGWRPALMPAAQVPTYAAGLPLLMAPLWALGGDAAARLVVVGAAAALVAVTGALGRAAAGAGGGAVAAALIVASPTVWHQSLGVMSDVPAAAAWALAWHGVTRSHAAQTGVMTAVAVLVRPNLAPLALLACWALPLWAGRRTMAMWTAAAGLTVAALQWHWYGSPLQSGYGSTSELFSTANIITNLRLYSGWMLEAEWTMVAAAAVIGAGALANAATRSRVAYRWTVLWFTAGVAAAYLIYAPFERWTYLRFLLPAWPWLAAGAGWAVSRLISGWSGPRSAAAAFALVVVLVSTGLWRARQLDVWTFTPLADRVVLLALELQPRLQGPTVMVAGEQSGAIRHLTGMPIIRWDLLDTATLEAALASVRRAGWQVWWVLDQSEEVLVRERHPTLASRPIDRPADLAAGRLLETRAWREP